MYHSNQNTLWTDHVSKVLYYQSNLSHILSILVSTAMIYNVHIQLCILFKNHLESESRPFYIEKVRLESLFTFTIHTALFVPVHTLTNLTCSLLFHRVNFILHNSHPLYTLTVLLCQNLC